MTFHTLDTEATWKLISQAMNRTDVTLHWPGSDEPALHQRQRQNCSLASNPGARIAVARAP